jgi:DnaJ homolog subfamily C member 19
MITKVLFLLALAFVALGSLRWAIARPRPRWLAPALAAAVVLALGWRFGAVAILAGALAFAALWYLPAPGVRPPVDMDEVAARALLGVPAGATSAEIRAAHRRLIVAAHPDRGGAKDEAARLNAARDILLRKLRGRV